MITNTLHEEVLIAGFGGQGIMLVGKLLAQTAMKAGKEVTYMPSYGAEVRGGTANCMVVISDEPIASPLVTAPDTLIAMNKASLKKFAPTIKSGGLLIMNSSLIDTKPELDKTIEILPIPADQFAQELGSSKTANMVILGAYLQKSGILKPDVAVSCLSEILAGRLSKTVPINTKALLQGAEFAKTCVR
jgi:2-oxoglutarate ferredoxin oxidoreductase subunit gamma